MDEGTPARRRTRNRSSRTGSSAGKPVERHTGRAPAGDFGGLYFGKAAAENEVALDADRFMRTYFDRWGLSQAVARHERFLILGPKGTGKSAASWYVSLDWKRRLGDHSIFAAHVDFDELNRTQTPLTSLDKRLVGDEVTHLTDTAWRLFLGVRFLESLVKDPHASLAGDWQAARLLKDLQTAGLASDDYPKVLRSVRERKGTIGFPKLVNGEYSKKDVEALSPGQLADAILELVLRSSSPNKHLLSIDGLDKAITTNEAYWHTLSALIRVADGFNRRALQLGASHIFLLVMCRSDVFRQVQFADAPKIAADAGVHIEWQAEAADPRDVLLWEYLARKAEVPVDRLLSVLPTAVKVGKQGGGVATLQYLLDFTRYTPRDMSLLFGELAHYATPEKPILGSDVRQACDRFATHHLLQEIVAESTGLLPRSVGPRLQSLLSAIPKRTFNKDGFETAMAAAGIDGEITSVELAEYLFLQGAIGNYRQEAGYYQFYHRRDAYRFQARGPWILHTGLVYALNIPW